MWLQVANQGTEIGINKGLDTRLKNLAVKTAKVMQKVMIKVKYKSSLEKVNKKLFSPYLTILKMTRYSTAHQKSDVQKVALRRKGSLEEYKTRSIRS